MYAGSNAGGTLILHANTSIIYTDGVTNYCGQAGLATCASAVTSVSANPDVTTVFFALAAFPEGSSPRLAGVTFGVDYDASALVMVAAGACSDFELKSESWPAPGSGTALTWNEARTSSLTELYWIAAYAYADTTTFRLAPHPTQGASFADDAVPSGLDEVVAFGRLGFGTPQGEAPCAVAPGGDGPPGDQGGGGLQTNGALKAIHRDATGQLIENPAESEPYPRFVRVLLAKGELPDIQPPDREVLVAEFRTAAIREFLSGNGVFSITRSVPGFLMSDTAYVRADGAQVRIPDLTRLITVKYDSALFAEQFAESLNAIPTVLWAEPYWGSSVLDVAPNDPKYQQGEQWGLERIGASPAAESVWAKVQGDPPAWRIGVVDASFHSQHPELGNGIGPNHKIRSAYDYISGDDDPSPDTTCDDPHGTMTTGVLAALTNNTEGIASLAGGWSPGSLGPELVCLRAICGGRREFARAVVDASSAVLPNGQPANCRIISCSNHTNLYMEAERMAAWVAYLRGTLICAAKGNNLNGVRVYPADFSGPCILAVGGSNAQDLRPDVPSTDSWSANYGYGIDLVAPGSGIWTTFGPDGYVSDNGTSFSTPLAAAAAAVLQMSTDWVLSPEDMEGLLRASAVDIIYDPDNAESEDLTGYDRFTGAGRLDLAGALSYLEMPNVLVQLTNDPAENYVEWPSDPEVQLFVEGFRQLPFPEGLVEVGKYRVYCAVHFPGGLEAVPPSWVVKGRTTGTSAATPNYSEPWAAIHPAEDPLTGCVLETFVYWVYSGSYSGWWPCSPWEVRAGVSILAPLSAAGVSSPAQSRPVEWTVLGSPGPAATFRFPAGTRGLGGVDIMDLGGRLVRALRAPEITGGSAVLTWDGRNDERLQSPAGVYFARLRSAGAGRPDARDVKKIVLVR